MRFVYSFLIILVAASLFMIPFSGFLYDFRTDNRDDEFNLDTAVGVTTANMTLLKAIYDDDTTTLSFSSDETADTTAYSSYNITSRLLVVSGLSENSTRILTVTYTYDALENSPSISTFIDITPVIWYALIVCLMAGAIVALFI